MNRYELRIEGLAAEPTLASVRWELYLFEQVRDVVRTDSPDVVAVLHEGRPEVEAWCEALAEAGYRAEPAAYVPGTAA